MKKLLLVFTACIAAVGLYAQQVTDLEEKTPAQVNGLEYGYYISNEKSKEVKGDDMDRFEIVIYVSNKSGTLKLIPFTNLDNVQEEVTVAEFSCRNATGKRLTAKNGKVNAKPWFTQVRIPDETASNKFKFVKAQVGYAIKAGETISTKIIVIVPKGERPKLSCRPVYFPEV